MIYAILAQYTSLTEVVPIGWLESTATVNSVEALDVQSREYKISGNKTEYFENELVMTGIKALAKRPMQGALRA